nr:carbohydrate ABC transporter permease [Ruthenibacterium lactatiformans]
MAIIIFTMVFNAGTIPGYLNMQELGLLNTYWAQIFPYAFSAFNCILMINSFRQIPYELIEAAQIDGASEPYIFFRIILPLSKPVLATIALFLAVGYWNNYFAAQLYCALDRDVWPVAMVLKQIMSEASTAILEAAQDPAAAALASKLGSKTIQYAAVVVTTVPIMCVYPFLQKYFAKGAMVGGVKG